MAGMRNRKNTASFEGEDRRSSGFSQALNMRAVLLLVLVSILALIFLANLIRTNHNASIKAETVKTNIQKVAAFDFSNVVDVEAILNQLAEEEAARLAAEEAARLEAEAAANDDWEPEPINYRALFSSSAIVGDSLTEGLSAYGWLGEELVFSKIGANIIYGDDLFAGAAYTYPKYAFFAFGMNDMLNYGSDVDGFINRYKELIEYFKSISPASQIFVNSISVPSGDAIANQPGLGNYYDYNIALRKMCKDMKITYIDATMIILENPELYAGDGIHVSSSYYPLWMDLMLEKAGIS